MVSLSRRPVALLSTLINDLATSGRTMWNLFGGVYHVSIPGSPLIIPHRPWFIAANDVPFASSDYGACDSMALLTPDAMSTLVPCFARILRIYRVGMFLHTVHPLPPTCNCAFKNSTMRIQTFEEKFWRPTSIFFKNNKYTFQLTFRLSSLSIN